MATTGLKQGYEDARKRKMGIEPGAHPEFDDDYQKHTGIDMSGIAGSVKRGAKKLFTGLLGPSESEIAKSAKYQGEMAYYNAKIKRNTPTRKPSY